MAALKPISSPKAGGNWPVKFFGLARRGSDEKGVSVSSGSKLADLQDNPILAEYAALYDYEGSLFEKSQTQD